MMKHSARSYLVRSVRLPVPQADELLAEAERTGEATALWDEDKRRAGVTDVRATVTYDGGAYEVHRPGFAHGMHFYYLDDLHPVDCEQCYCRHHRHDGRSAVLRGDPPSTCQCGHLTSRHRFRQVRDTIDVCRDPGSWYTDDMRTFNALAG